LLESPLNKTQRHYVDVIRSSGDALLTVINDILEFSKVESGSLQLEPQVFAPEALADDLIALLGPAAARKGIELLCRLDPTVPAWAFADATRLRQVLLNVLANAVKFTESGEVLVTIEHPAAGRLRYTVRDTGIGMTPEQMRRVFDPFTQADASTTRRFGGLGLAISQRLVTQMGGSILLSSSPGEGSSFVVEIDAATVSAPASAPTPVRLDTLLGQRVLLVDNNDTNLEIVTAVATGWGMRASSFNDPQRALEAFGDGTPFDLAVLDFNMPGMDGAELAERLHRVRPDLPVLLLSSNDAASRTNAHFAAQLNKPLRRTQLLDALLTVLGRPPGAADSGWSVSGSSTLPPDDPAAPSVRVLVVEDNPVNAMMVRTMLERLGHLSEHAGSGREAVQALARQAYDLVFMDMLMPEMDGLEATRQIRSLAMEQQPYIVAFTANVMVEDRAACAVAGMDAFVGKPLRMTDLERCLEDFTRATAAVT
jgi:CheY-like chemotaxis protein/anti-sigma regulatory factor (Ser/Thr protein kinase)